MQTKYKFILGGMASFFVIAYLLSKRNKDGGTSSAPVSDSLSEAKIKTLHPKVRDKAREFLNKAEKQGIKLRIVSAYRTYAEQDALYAKGRTKAGSIVTKAKAGQSSHNFGTAIDVAPLENGKLNWKGDWKKIASIGKSVGFEWGGDWKSFKDQPHFQMNFGNSLAELRSRYESGKKENGYVILT